MTAVLLPLRQEMVVMTRRTTHIISGDRQTDMTRRTLLTSSKLSVDVFTSSLTLMTQGVSS